MTEIKSVREPEENEPEAILNGHAFRVPEVKVDSASDRIPDKCREHIRNRFQAVAKASADAGLTCPLTEELFIQKRRTI